MQFFFKLLFCFSALFFLAQALEERSFLERSSALPLPAGWTRLTSYAIVQSDREINLIFALKNKNLDQLDSTFWAVSDPKNAQYGQHLSIEQIAALTAPSTESIDAIVAWLAANGVESQVTLSRDFIRATVSTSVAAKLFNVEYHTYAHVSGMEIDTTVGPYSLPSHLAENVDLVSGVVGFPQPFYPHYETGKPSYLGDEITPEVIRSRYNVSSSLTCTNPNNMQAVAEFQGQYYSDSDLQTFWADFVPFAPYKPVTKVVGKNNQDRPGVEASLDVEYIMGVAPECPTWFYSYASFNFLQDLLDWVADIENEASPPWVHSVSYGEQGNYPSVAYRANLNAQFQKIGARGISILFASGDSGAGCEGGLDATPRPDSCDCTLYPSFPATCPYITSVGATRFINGNTGPEAAVYLFKSGGGFSQDFPTASYQEDAVNAYFRSGVNMPPTCAFNASGRGTPDVGALGDEHFQVVNGGRTMSIGGTSASCPSFAAIVTLLNDIRLNSGDATLGFLNPFLYQTASSNPDAFYDISIGDNLSPTCCRSGGNGGFETAPGWDPVTGLGTPNFATLKRVV